MHAGIINLFYASKRGPWPEVSGKTWLSRPWTEWYFINYIQWYLISVVPESGIKGKNKYVHPTNNVGCNYLPHALDTILQACTTATAYIFAFEHGLVMDFMAIFSIQKCQLERKRMIRQFIKFVNMLHDVATIVFDANYAISPLNLGLVLLIIACWFYCIHFETSNICCRKINAENMKVAKYLFDTL